MLNFFFLFRTCWRLMLNSCKSSNEQHSLLPLLSCLCDFVTPSWNKRIILTLKRENYEVLAWYLSHYFVLISNYFVKPSHYCVIISSFLHNIIMLYIIMLYRDNDHVQTWSLSLTLVKATWSVRNDAMSLRSDSFFLRYVAIQLKILPKVGILVSISSTKFKMKFDRPTHPSLPRHDTLTF